MGKAWLGQTALVALVALALVAPARGVEGSVAIEAGVALPLGGPQAARFGVGGGVSVAPTLALTPWLALEVDLGALALGGTDGAGAAFTAGGGARVERERASGTITPFVAAALLYARTGPLDRFAFTAAIGVHFSLGASRAIALGPFVRYLQIVEPSRAGFDDTDAKILIAGLSLELRPAAPQPLVAPVEPPALATPPAHRDSDGDGILDKEDKCPNVPEDKDGFQDEDGCPDPDNDGDGIPDVVDRCPNQPEDRDGFEDSDGCPDPDNDKDGTDDFHDECPNVAGPAQTHGCPDHDLDGVPDSADRCPDVAGPVENGGCPVYRDVRVTKDKLELGEKIYFAHDLTQVLPRSFPLLDQVVQALKDHRALKVRIEGHTDDRGKAAHNLTLSEGRARAIETYLAEHGIAPDRLVSKGYGSSLPIDTNKTVDGREHNRRVEFVILAGGDGQGGAR